MLSPQLCKAARVLLHWSTKDLAEAASLGVATVWRLESGLAVRPRSIDAIRDAFERAGLEFIPVGGISASGGEGLRKRR